MNGDKKWQEHELRTLAVQKLMLDKAIDRMIWKVSAINDGGGHVGPELKAELQKAAKKAVDIKAKMKAIREDLNG